MGEKFMTWDEFEKKLNITPEQEEQIRLEMEIIDATIKAREKEKLSQRDLSQKSGIKQSAIARIERLKNSPRIDTMMKLLYSMGYTLKVVPIDKTNK